MTDIGFPAVSAKDPDAEGVLSTWFVADGDQVREGDLLVEVAVDKVDMEITAPAAGTVQLLLAEGESAKQGTVIARLD